jgi:flagellar basal-body rod protein FlgF
MAMPGAKHSNLIMMSRQFAIEKEIEHLSAALAHKEVSGYQATAPRFEEHIQGGMSYVKLAGIMRDLNHGPLKHTGQPLDIATTVGYFAVMTPLGVRYTRNGHFHLSNTGEVVNTEGYSLLNDGGTPIVLQESESVVIGADGSVSTQNGVLGRIKVVEFDNEQTMNDDDIKGYYATSEPEAIPSDFRVLQGSVEGSNVDTVKSLMRFSILSHRWQDSHQVQKKHDELEMEAPSKLAPV